MKNRIVAACLCLMLVAALSSCATNRDCRGVKHERLANGVTI